MSTYGLDRWVEKLKNQNMPVLGDVIYELNQITGADDSDVNQLAEVILRDPNLTSHVLKVANSVHFNYAKAQINTVSRAIVHIGLKGVRAICISSLVMESLLKGESKDRVLALVSQGFHAATQARNLVSMVESEAAEEVFIAALLFNLGEMAFWSSESLAHFDEDLLDVSPKVRAAAMQRVLGASFKSITRGLAKHWKLGETLEQALFPPKTYESKKASDKVTAVITGERLSRAALYGWDSPQLKKVLKEVADYANCSLEDALSMVKKGGDQAAEVALSYGVPEACPLIPNSLAEVVIERKRPKSKVLKGDTSIQLSILRDLAAATSDGIGVNTIFQMVLEGMHRGIGLERVCLAFVSRRRLAAKYMLGEGTDHWRRSFSLDVGPFTDSIFTYTMEKGGSHWFDEKFVGAHKEYYPEEQVSLLGRFPSFAHVIEIDGRQAALFYCDRWNFGGKLSAEQFESFKHFAGQAEISLNLLSQKNDKART